MHVGHGARAGLPSPFARRYIPPAVPPPTRVAGEERQREGQLADNFQTVFDACASRLRCCDLCLATPTTQRLSRMPPAYPCNALGVSSGYVVGLYVVAHVVVWPPRHSFALRMARLHSPPPSTYQAHVHGAGTHARWPSWRSRLRWSSCSGWRRAALPAGAHSGLSGPSLCCE